MPSPMPSRRPICVHSAAPRELARDQPVTMPPTVRGMSTVITRDADQHQRGRQVKRASGRREGGDRSG